MSKPNKKQEGIVSLLVVVILTIVMALVAVGFSKLMDREVRRSLDNELSAQAYYSAISGMNDARAWLAATDAQYSLQGCSDWQNKPQGKNFFSANLDGSGSAKYSCVSVDTTPDYLSYPLATGQSVVFKLSEKDMNRMYFGWQSNYSPPPPPGTGFVPLVPGSNSLGKLPQENSSLTKYATGLLEVNLYPTPTGWPGSPSPAGWPANTNSVLEAMSRTYFMYPNSGGGLPGSVDYTKQNGNFVSGNCKGNNSFQLKGSTAGSSMCNAYINNLMYNGRDYTASNTYYVRLTARYAPIVVTVQAADLKGDPINQLSGAQAVIDVTGQGTDVLQRISARVGLNETYPTPSYALQSMVALCKGFDVEVSSPGNYGSATNDGGISAYNYNSACASPAGGGAIVGPNNDFGPPSKHTNLPPVQNPFPLVTDQLSASPLSLYTGQSTTFSWSSSNANTCSAKPSTGPSFSTGGAANSPPQGVAVGPFTSAGNYTYSITCVGYSGYEDSNNVTISVTQPPTPSIALWPNTTTVKNGGYVNLYWRISNATSCYGNGFGMPSSTDFNDGITISPLAGPSTHSYSITCYDGPTVNTTSSPVVVTVYPSCAATATHSGSTAYINYVNCGSGVSYSGSGHYYQCSYYGRTSLGCDTLYVNWSGSSSGTSFPPSSGNQGYYRWTASNYYATFNVSGSYGSTSTSVSWP